MTCGPRSITKKYFERLYNLVSLNMRQVLIELQHEDPLGDGLVQHLLDAIRSLYVGGPVVSSDIECPCETLFNRPKLRKCG